MLFIKILFVLIILYLAFYNRNMLYRRFKPRFEEVPGKGGLGVDMVYCITMKNRKAYVNEQMKGLDCPYKLFNAITPQDLSYLDYLVMSSTYIPYKNPGIYRKFTRLPVGLSFFMCYLDAFKNGYKNIMVLEDDIKFNTSIEELKKTIGEWKSTHCQIMYLGYCHLNCKKAKYEELTSTVHQIVSDQKVVCNHALLIKREMLEKYFEKFHFWFMDRQNDNVLDRFVRSNNIPRCVPPRGYVQQNVPMLGSNNENKNDKLHTCHVKTNTKFFD